MITYIGCIHFSNLVNKRSIHAGWTPLISALGKQKDFYEFQDSLVYIVPGKPESYIVILYIKKPKMKLFLVLGPRRWLSGLGHLPANLTEFESHIVPQRKHQLG